MVGVGGGVVLMCGRYQKERPARPGSYRGAAGGAGAGRPCPAAGAGSMMVP